MPHPQLTSFKISSDRVTDLSFNYDGSLLAVGTAEADQDYGVLFNGAIELWNLDSNSKVGIIQNHIPVAVDLAFTPDGDALLVAGASVGRDPNTSHVQLVNIEDFTVITEFSPQSVSTIPISNGSTLVLGTLDEYGRSSIEFWDVETAERLREIQINEEEIVSALSVNADSSVLASGSINGIIETWDMESGAEYKRFQNPGGWVLQLALNVDGTMLASIGRDDPGGSIRIWDTETGNQLAILNHPTMNSEVCDV